MAETAKILAPGKTVLIPDARAGCSLADSIDAEQLRDWKAEHPSAVVVSYVNTSAEVKAETDICCTSSNAVEVVDSVPADRDVLFLPDQFLGAYVQRDHGPDEPAHLGRRMPRARRDQRFRARRYKPLPRPTPSCSSIRNVAARPAPCISRARVRYPLNACGSCPPAACSTPPGRPERAKF